MEPPIFESYFKKIKEKLIFEILSVKLHCMSLMLDLDTTRFF